MEYAYYVFTHERSIWLFVLSFLEVLIIGIKELTINEEIEAKYAGEDSASRVTVPEVKADYVTYDAPTDTELESLAQAGLNSYASASRDNINSTADEKIASATKKRAEAQSDYDESVSAIASYYDDARKKSSDSALKRGLARSSIAQLGQDELTKSEAHARTSARADFDASLRALDDAITQAEQSRAQALREFDIAYAAKLTQELNELKSERDKKQTEVTKYNNDLAMRLAEYAKDTASWAQKYEDAQIDLDAKKGVSGTGKASQEVYRAVVDYLSDMTPKEARKELDENPYYRTVLSDYDFNVLRNVYSTRIDWRV